MESAPPKPISAAKAVDGTPLAQVRRTVSPTTGLRVGNEPPSSPSPPAPEQRHNIVGIHVCPRCDRPSYVDVLRPNILNNTIYRVRKCETCDWSVRTTQYVRRPMAMERVIQ